VAPGQRDGHDDPGRQRDGENTGQATRPGDCSRPLAQAAWTAGVRAVRAALAAGPCHAAAAHRSGQGHGNPAFQGGEHVMSGQAVGFSPPDSVPGRVKTRSWARDDVLPGIHPGVSEATRHSLPTPMHRSGRHLHKSIPRRAGTGGTRPCTPQGHSATMRPRRRRDRGGWATAAPRAGPCHRTTTAMPRTAAARSRARTVEG
jgi:hypothetical protein